MFNVNRVVSGVNRSMIHRIKELLSKPAAAPYANASNLSWNVNSMYLIWIKHARGTHAHCSTIVQLPFNLSALHIQHLKVSTFVRPIIADRLHIN